MLLLESTVYPTAGTVLTNKLKPFYQYLVVGSLVLWIVIMAIGWVRFVMIDDGLNQFTGDERARAEIILKEKKVEMTLCRTRVVKEDNSLDMKLYTWWGITVSQSLCDDMYGSPWKNFET